MPPISSVNFPSSLLDIQPLKVSCPSAMPSPPLGAPTTVPQQDPRLREAQAGPRTLPAPLWRAAARSRKARSATTPSVGKVKLPTCNFQHVDSRAPKTGPTNAESDRPSDPKIPNEPALPPALPSVKTAEGALLQRPKPPGTSAGSAAGGLRPRQGAGPHVGISLSSEQARGHPHPILALAGLSGRWGSCGSGRNPSRGGVGDGLSHSSCDLVLMGDQTVPGAQGRCQRSLDSRLQLSEVPKGADRVRPGSLSWAWAQSTGGQVWGPPRLWG